MALDARQSSLLLRAQSLTTDSVLSAARSRLRSVTARVLVRLADKILNELEQILARIDASKLPPLQIFELEDGSLLIEWVMPNRRAAITLEQNSADSGWYLLSNEPGNQTETWGYLESLDLAQIVNHMMQKATV